jgi:hypothetical protein
LVHQGENEDNTDLLFFAQPRRFPNPHPSLVFFQPYNLYIYAATTKDSPIKPFFMRSAITYLLVSGILFTACNNNRSKAITITSADGKSKVSIDVNSAPVSSDDMQKKVDELKKLTPLTPDQLKALLPEEIIGMKRSSFEANTAMGFAVAEAKYTDSSTGKQINVSIFDCAGEAGAGIYSLNYWTRMSMESESDNGYQKTVDFGGQKAVESYEKGSDTYELTYVASNRLLATIKGEKTGLDAVKQVAQSLNLKVN